MNNFILSSRFFVVSRFIFDITIYITIPLRPVEENANSWSKFLGRKEGRGKIAESRRRLSKSIGSTPTFFSLPSPSKVGRDLDARSRKRGRRNRGVNRGVYQRLFLHAFTRRFRNTTRRSSPVSSRYLMNFVPRIEEIAFSIARHVHSGDRWKAFNDRPVSLPRKEVAILDPALLVSGRWWSCSPTNDSP